jgi:hypothetical protein
VGSTGLERHYHGPAARGRAGGDKSRDFGMGMAGTWVGTLPDHLSVRIKNDGPDSGIGMGAMRCREFKRPAHVGGVVLTTQANT